MQSVPLQTATNLVPLKKNKREIEWEWEWANILRHVMLTESQFTALFPFLYQMWWLDRAPPLKQDLLTFKQAMTDSAYSQTLSCNIRLTCAKSHFHLLYFSMQLRRVTNGSEFFDWDVNFSDAMNDNSNELRDNRLTIHPFTTTKLLYDLNNLDSALYGYVLFIDLWPLLSSAKQKRNKDSEIKVKRDFGSCNFVALILEMDNGLCHFS